MSDWSDSPTRRERPKTASGKQGMIFEFVADFLK
jgi:hypothetical protein